MDKSALDKALVDLISTKAGAEKTIAQLARQVWQIDYTVCMYEIVTRYIHFDIPYFYHFMKMDIGDEEEEKQILLDWINTRDALDKEGKKKIPALVDELNQIKATARKG